MDRHGQAFSEHVERVQDVIGAERFHVDTHIVEFGTADDNTVRIEQLTAYGDFQIDTVVVGNGNHALAMNISQSPGYQGIRVRYVGTQIGYVQRQIVQVRAVDAFLIAVDHHRADTPLGEAPGEDPAGVAVAADEVERLAQLANGVPKAGVGNGMAEGGVL